MSEAHRTPAGAPPAGRREMRKYRREPRRQAFSGLSHHADAGARKVRQVLDIGSRTHYGRFHTIQILAQNHKNLKVRSRRGYYAPAR